MLETFIQFSVAATLSTVLIAGPTAPVHAMVGISGSAEKGLQLNGTKTRYNGCSINADSPDGGRSNGKDIKGKDANGVAGSLAAVAIDGNHLPASR